MLSLAEKIVLSSIDEKKSKISAYAYNFYRFGIKGAVLLKLIEFNKVKLEDKKLHMIDGSSTGDEVLDMALKYISQSKRPISTNSWIYGHTVINRDLKNKVVQKLEDSGILIQEKKRFLGLIPMKRYNITNLSERQNIIELVSSILLEDSKNTTFENVIFVSMAAVCGCLRLFADKRDLKSIKDKVKQIKKGEYFALEDNNLNEVIKAIKSALAAQAAAAGSAGV